MFFLDELLLDSYFDTTAPIKATTAKTGVYAPPTLPNFMAYLRNLEVGMFDLGWAVIGSYNKIPKLHPWKAPSREQLHLWAQQNLLSGRANSLNLRLADTATIALDCDFHSPELMQLFMQMLQDYLLLDHDQFYTCCGKKGAKIFFRYQKASPDERLPRQLGPLAYSAGHGSDVAYQQELELKSDVSTVAGLYGMVNGREVVYGPYADYKFVCHTRPMDLPLLTASQLRGIEWRYHALLHAYGMVNDNNNRVLPPPQSRFTTEALCSVVFLRYLFGKGSEAGKLDAIVRNIEQGANRDFLLVWLNFTGQFAAYRALSALYEGIPPAEVPLWQSFKQHLLSLAPIEAWNWLLSSSNWLFSLMLPEVQSLRFRLVKALRGCMIDDLYNFVWAYAPLPVFLLSSSLRTSPISFAETVRLIYAAVQQPHYRV